MLEALCVLLGKKPTKVPRQARRRATDPSFDFWASAVKLLGDPALAQRLLRFDPDSVSPQTLRRLRLYAA